MTSKKGNNRRYIDEKWIDEPEVGEIIEKKMEYEFNGKKQEVWAGIQSLNTPQYVLLRDKCSTKADFGIPQLDNDKLNDALILKCAINPETKKPLFSQQSLDKMKRNKKHGLYIVLLSAVCTHSGLSMQSTDEIEAEKN